MSKVFICYRREDSAGRVGRLYDTLRATFEATDIFMDLDSLSPGQNFEEEISKAIRACDFMLVMIGPEWINIKDRAGGRRLDNEQDYVRQEIRTALRLKVPAIPVLVEDANMPAAQELPQDIRQLSTTQASEISDLRFHDDVKRLLSGIGRTSPSESRAVKFNIRLLLWAVFISCTLAMFLTPYTNGVYFLWGWALAGGMLLGQISYCRRWRSGMILGWCLVPLAAVLFCLNFFKIEDQEELLGFAIFYAIPLAIWTFNFNKVVGQLNVFGGSLRYPKAILLTKALGAAAAAVFLISGLHAVLALDYLLYPMRAVCLILLICGGFLIEASRHQHLKTGRALGWTGVIGFVLFASGNFTGTVVDPVRAVIPAASVTPASGDGTLTTDARGRFSVPFIPVGSYQATFEVKGFQSTRQSVTVLPLFWWISNITLEPGEGGSPDYTKSPNYLFIGYGLVYSLVCGLYGLRTIRELRGQPTRLPRAVLAH